MGACLALAPARPDTVAMSAIPAGRRTGCKMTILRNIAAVILGLAVGFVVNMSLVTLGPMLVPPPAGVDVTDAQSLSESIHLFEPKHFVFPFLAHALGTLSGGLAAYLVAASQRAILAYVVGAFSLAGGIAASVMIPAPAWFVFLDLVIAYVPMAWLATVVGGRLKR